MGRTPRTSLWPFSSVLATSLSANVMEQPDLHYDPRGCQSHGFRRVSLPSPSTDLSFLAYRSY